MFNLINKLKNKLQEEKGAAMVEYGLLVAGVALVAMASVSVMGHKTTDLFSATAAVLPGAHDDDNAPIVSGKLIETAQNADGNIALDGAGIAANQDTFRLGTNLGFENAGEDITDLVVEA